MGRDGPGREGQGRGATLSEPVWGPECIHADSDHCGSMASFNLRCVRAFNQGREPAHHGVDAAASKLDELDLGPRLFFCIFAEIKSETRLVSVWYKYCWSDVSIYCLVL